MPPHLFPLCFSCFLCFFHVPFQVCITKLINYWVPALVLWPTVGLVCLPKIGYYLTVKNIIILESFVLNAMYVSIIWWCTCEIDRFGFNASSKHQNAEAKICLNLSQPQGNLFTSNDTEANSCSILSM